MGTIAVFSTTSGRPGTGISLSLAAGQGGINQFDMEVADDASVSGTVENLPHSPPLPEIGAADGVSSVAWRHGAMDPSWGVDSESRPVYGMISGEDGDLSEPQPCASTTGRCERATKERVEENDVAGYCASSQK